MVSNRLFAFQRSTSVGRVVCRDRRRGWSCRQNMRQRHAPIECVRGGVTYDIVSRSKYAMPQCGAGCSSVGGVEARFSRRCWVTPCSVVYVPGVAFHALRKGIVSINTEGLLLLSAILHLLESYWPWPHHPLHNGRQMLGLDKTSLSIPTTL